MDTFTKWGLFLLILTVLFGAFGILLILGMLYDTLYIKPIADKNANDYCKSKDFDQYKTFSRIGLFSKIPVGIKCEYAEKYTDLGVRTSST